MIQDRDTGDETERHSPQLMVDRYEMTGAYLGGRIAWIGRAEAERLFPGHPAEDAFDVPHLRPATVDDRADDYGEPRVIAALSGPWGRVTS